MLRRIKRMERMMRAMKNAEVTPEQYSNYVEMKKLSKSDTDYNSKVEDLYTNLIVSFKSNTLLYRSMMLNIAKGVAWLLVILVALFTLPFVFTLITYIMCGVSCYFVYTNFREAYYDYKDIKYVNDFPRLEK